MRGVVKWFSNPKGYGFITADDNNEDVFVHFTKIQMDDYKTLSQGQVVTFDLIEGRDGKPTADNVVPTSEIVKEL